MHEYQLFDTFVYGGAATSITTTTNEEPFGQMAALVCNSIEKNAPGTFSKRSIRVLDLGCGTGNLSIPIITALVNTFPEISIALVAVDHGQETAFSNARYSQKLSEISADGRVTVEYISFDLNMDWKAIEGQFDIIIASFLLHHLVDFKAGVRKILSKAHPETLILLSAITGDYAGWSRCFDKCIIEHTAQESNHSDRFNVLRFMKDMHILFESNSNWPNSRATCASDTDAIVQTFTSLGCPQICMVSERYDQDVPIEIYMEQLDKSQPVLSTIPPNFSKGVRPENRAQWDSLKETAVGLRGKRYRNSIDIHILKPGILNDVAERSPKGLTNQLFYQSIDLFAELVNVSRPDQLPAQLGTDLVRLAKCGFVSGKGNICGVFYEHKTALDLGQWNNLVPIVPYGLTKDETVEQLTRQAVFFLAGRIIASSQTYTANDRSRNVPSIRSLTTTEILYRVIPSKVVFTITYLDDSVRCSARVSLSRTGSIASLHLELPAEWLPDDALTVLALARNPLQNAIVAAMVRSEVPTIDKLERYCQEYFNTLDSAHRFQFCKIVENSEQVTSLTLLLGNLAKDLSIIDDRWKLINNSIWKRLALSLSLAYLSGKKLIHIPASTIFDDSPSSNPQNDFASGGAIFTTQFPEDHHIDSEGVQRALQLRHRSVFAIFQKQRLLVHAQRSARAAVFARNFSHIIGSHVISDPEFKAALVGDTVLNLLRTRMDEACRKFVQAEESYLRDGLDMDTEALWRKGTEALDNVRLALTHGGALLENTRRFHEYLQGRFDFIARAIDGTQDQPEPLFFVSDLLNGFLNQTAFLDRLVADLGLGLDRMRFHLTLPDARASGLGVEFVADWEEDPKTGAKTVGWRRLCGGLPNDRIEDHAVMVSVPGGMVSAHAFFSLLENIIRNSAKYAPPIKANQNYELHLSLERKPDKNYYILKIWDNFSKEKCGKWKLINGTETESLRMFVADQINADFIDGTGRARTEGLGMLEMQACAESLCRKATSLKDGTVSFPDERARNLRVSAKKADKPLEFSLCLHAPVLLGRVIGAAATRTYSKDFITVESAISEGANLLVVNGENISKDDCFKTIESFHHALPYRLLIMCKDKNTAGAWHNLISQSTVLPKRRLKVWCAAEGEDSSLYERVFTRKECTPLKGMDEEQDGIIAAHEAWLLAWKGRPEGGKWHLWIGMERTKSQVEEAWKAPVRTFNSNLIQMGARAYQQGAGATGLMVSGDEKDAFACPQPQGSIPDGTPQTEKAEATYWATELHRPHCKKRALVFDNHGNCFKWALDVERTTRFADATRFYQKLSGTLTPDLFRTLSHPPSQTFAFSFFIHSLVESCLANVMIVDERLAWNLMKGTAAGDSPNTRFREDLAAHHKAGVFPAFSFKRDAVKDRKFGYPAPEHQVMLGQLVPYNKNGNPDLADEGVRFGTTEDNKPTTLTILTPPRLPRTKEEANRFIKGFGLLPSLRAASVDGRPCVYQADGKIDCPNQNCDSLECDVLLIHEGALDLVAKSRGVEWDSEYAERLYEIAPAIVRTSGRGRETKQLRKWFPFIEFGEVSSAVLTGRNKYSLTRGLLGSCGPKEKQQ